MVDVRLECLSFCCEATGVENKQFVLLDVYDVKNVDLTKMLTKSLTKMLERAFVMERGLPLSTPPLKQCSTRLNVGKDREKSFTSINSTLIWREG